MKQPQPTSSADALLTAHANAVAAYLESTLRSYPGIPDRLRDSILYSLLAGGKRLRPALVLEFAQACQTKDEDRRMKDEQEPSSSPSSPPSSSSFILHPSSLALPAAAAIELIHTFSLVHDDLPAMDDDDLRRGRPTNHKVYGEALAILAGDAMTTLAFELLSTPPSPVGSASADSSPLRHSERSEESQPHDLRFPSPAQGREPDSASPDRSRSDLIPLSLIRELAHASGPAGMIGGQVLDIDGENQSLTLPQLQHLHRLKTGALLRCACRMGVLAAGGSPDQLAAATAYGQHLGLAFQIVDDLLDVTSTPEQMGKATNKDKDKGKNTYPSLLGLDASRHQAEHELTAALASLTPFGPAAEGLKNLAKFVVQRTH